MKANQAAFECGQLAERMGQGHYVHMAVIGVASDPRARYLIPELQPGYGVPVGFVAVKMVRHLVICMNTSLSKRRPIP